MFKDICGKEVKFFEFHSAAARDLISQLLAKDASERIQDAGLIMRHPFFAQIDWEKLMKREL